MSPVKLRALRVHVDCEHCKNAKVPREQRYQPPPPPPPPPPPDEPPPPEPEELELCGSDELTPELMFETIELESAPKVWPVLMLAHVG